MFVKKQKLVDNNEINRQTKKLFLVEMPEDFFHLWHFCHNLNPYNPKAALVDSLKLFLVGPYDLLDGKLDVSGADQCPEKYLCYYRYFYDPPEFQTVIRENNSNFHIGYFRDSPTDKPSMVCSNDSDKSCIIEPLGDNLFSALINLCDKKPVSDKNAKTLAEKLARYADEKGISLKNEAMTKRNKKIVAKSFHRAGIVVPVKNDVGYRPLPESDAKLKSILKKIIDTKENREQSQSYKDLKAIINLTNLANDECDFGMTLELGIDLFCFGHEFFHKIILFLLGQAYELLDRQDFGKITEAHLAHRKNETAMKFSVQ